MIIFHEGLPRAGKSYEAMAERIVPAIAKGRPVVAYVEGINHAQIAHLASVTEERCRELLKAVTRDELQSVQVDERTRKDVIVDHLPDLVVDNAMVVLDEAQNFWGNRARLSAAMTKLITEHGHRGIDIILMGQDIRDVHATWRRRVELKLSFLKLNGLKLPKALQWLFLGKFGTDGNYSVTTYRHKGGDEYERLGLVVRTYDPRYFGTYKSYVAEDTNTEVYEDKRAQAWNHPLIKYVIPGFAVAAVWGGFEAWAFFHPTDKPAVVAKAGPPPGPARHGPPPRAAVPAPAVAVAASAVVDQRSPIERRMSELAGKGRIRLAGLVSMGQRTSGIIEWVQGSTVVVERLSLDALRTLGVGVVISGDVVQLAVGDYQELATPWPLEDMARVSDARQERIRGPQSPTAATPLPPGLGQAAPQPPTFAELPGPLSRPGGATRYETLGSAVNRAAGGQL
jgi:zona occludens toxin